MHDDDDDAVGELIDPVLKSFASFNTVLDRNHNISFSTSGNDASPNNNFSMVMGKIYLTFGPGYPLKIFKQIKHESQMVRRLETS